MHAPVNFAGRPTALLVLLAALLAAVGLVCVLCYAPTPHPSAKMRASAPYASHDECAGCDPGVVLSPRAAPFFTKLARRRKCVIRDDGTVCTRVGLDGDPQPVAYFLRTFPPGDVWCFNGECNPENRPAASSSS